MHLWLALNAELTLIAARFYAGVLRDNRTGDIVAFRKLLQYLCDTIDSIRVVCDPMLQVRARKHRAVSRRTKSTVGRDVLKVGLLHIL